LRETKLRAAEEFFAILFLYMPNCQKYGMVLEDMENAVLQKDIPSR